MKKLIVAALLGTAGLTSVSTAVAQENPFMVRLRAVNINFENGQKDGLPGSLGGSKVEAKDLTIPEIDITYFFTKNIAAELVLTYPQKIDIEIGGAKQGTIKALPPSLLLQYHFTDSGAFKPYVGAGVNYTRFTDRSNILNGGASVDRSSTGLVFQIGADYMFTKNWGVNADLKYAQMATDVTTTTKVGKVDLNPTMFALGVTYKY